jgi:hypothetical protein
VGLTGRYHPYPKLPGNNNQPALEEKRKKRRVTRLSFLNLLFLLTTTASSAWEAILDEGRHCFGLILGQSVQQYEI